MLNVEGAILLDKECVEVRNILSKYERAAGQAVDYGKSSVCFIPNVVDGVGVEGGCIGLVGIGCVLFTDSSGSRSAVDCSLLSYGGTIFTDAKQLYHACHSTTDD
ncbi:hypothetical protein GOBAR_DD06745 [Gossypium barbadense]|nr:hypothetical protein GOBAR_DD06745 [Gossypium barbadense]